VVGRLQPPEGFVGKVRWNFALIRAESGAAKDRAGGPVLWATVDRDGQFRIDDAPAGDYSLSVQFQRDAAGSLRNHRFQVPPPQGDLAGQPVDLGILGLEKR